MIEEIYRATRAEREKYGYNVAIQIKMHPSVFNECMYCNHSKVMTAFNPHPSRSPKTMFGYPLEINSSMNTNEWSVN